MYLMVKVENCTRTDINLASIRQIALPTTTKCMAAICAYSVVRSPEGQVVYPEQSVGEESNTDRRISNENSGVGEVGRL